MPKKFFTERDIEELFASGTRQLQISGEVVLTGLAYEKAHQLGMELDGVLESPPSAPVRPYISNSSVSSGNRYSSSPSISEFEDTLRQRVRKAVSVRLGNQVEPALLDTILTRILKSIKI